MFHLTCLVDDKKLVAVMHRLSGLVANLQVVPATNVEVKGGKPRSKVPGGRMPFLALEAWRKSGKPEVSLSEIGAFCEAVGFTPTSHSYAVQELKRAGLIQQLGGGRYALIEQRAAKPPKASKPKKVARSKKVKRRVERVTEEQLINGLGAVP